MTEGKTIRPDRLILADNRPLGHGARAATVTRLAVLMGVCIFPVPLGLSLWSWISTGDHRPGAVADNLPVFLGLLSCAFVFGIGLTLTLRTSLPHRTSVVLAHDCLAVDLCYVGGFRSRWTIPLADVADVRLVRHPTPMAQETERSLSVVTSLLIHERTGARHHWDLHDPDGRLYPKGGELAIRSALYPRLWSSQSGSSAIDPSTTSAA